MKRPPVPQEVFDIVILTMACKGLVKLTDDEARVTANVARMKERLKEGE